MRFRFTSLSRPLALAQRFQPVFPGLGHMRSMNWAASVYGYRDWHDLVANTALTQEPTRDLRYRDGPNGRELVPEDREEALVRRQALEHRLLKLVGTQLPGWDVLCELLWTTASRHPRYPRLATIGKGHPFYAGLAHDLFQATDDAGRPTEDAGRGILLYADNPAGLDEQQLLTKAQAFVDRGLGTELLGGELKTALACLGDGPFGQSTLTVGHDDDEDDQMATQTRAIRFWAMRDQEVTGFSVVVVTSRALQDGNEAHVEVDLRCAAGTFLQREFARNSLAAITTSVTEPLERLCWMRVGCTEPTFIQVDVEASALAHTGAWLALALPRALREDLGQGGCVPLDGVNFRESRTLRVMPGARSTS